MAAEGEDAALFVDTQAVLAVAEGEGGDAAEGFGGRVLGVLLLDLALFGGRVGGVVGCCGFAEGVDGGGG